MSCCCCKADEQYQAVSQNGEKSRKNGALLFAVVGGKLSEGGSLEKCLVCMGTN